MICSSVKRLGAETATEQASRKASGMRQVIRYVIHQYGLHVELLQGARRSAASDDDRGSFSGNCRAVSRERCADLTASERAAYVRRAWRRGGADGARAGRAGTWRGGPDWRVVHQLCGMDSVASGVYADRGGAGECQSGISGLRTGVRAAQIWDEGAVP